MPNHRISYRRGAQFILKLAPRGLLPATHAADEVETAVEINHFLAAGGLMKPVDVLGQNDLSRPAFPQFLAKRPFDFERFKRLTERVQPVLRAIENLS